MSKRLKPNYGNAILKPIETGETKYNAIIIPDIGNEKLIRATIVDIAPIYNFNLGTLVPSIFNIGDIVVVPPMGSQRVILDREEYIICAVNDLAASVIEE